MKIIKQVRLDLNEEVHNRLQKLRKGTKSHDLVDVFRKSLSIYEFLWENQDKGGEVQVYNSDGELIKFKLI